MRGRDVADLAMWAADGDDHPVAIVEMGEGDGFDSWYSRVLAVSTTHIVLADPCVGAHELGGDILIGEWFTSASVALREWRKTHPDEGAAQRPHP